MNHANILVLYGVCLKPLCFITEYMENGSLYSVMLLNKKASSAIAAHFISKTDLIIE